MIAYGGGPLMSGLIAKGLVDELASDRIWASSCTADRIRSGGRWVYPMTIASRGMGSRA